MAYRSILVLVCLAIMGCRATYFPYRGDTRGKTTQPILSASQDGSSDFSFATRALRQHRQRSPTSSNTKEEGGQRTVIIVPIPGTSRSEPQRLLERMLEEKGIHAVRLEAKEDPFQWDRLWHVRTKQDLEAELRHIAHGVETILTDTLNAVDAATKSENGTPRCVGIAGFSTGVLVAALAMGANERICAGAFTMGGGKPHSMLAYSEEPSLKRARTALLERLRWSQQELASAAEPYFRHLDPVRHSATIHPSEVLYIDAACGTPDGYIPNDAIEALWQALGQPERYCFHQSHKVAFVGLFLWDTAFRIVRFFEKQL